MYSDRFSRKPLYIQLRDSLVERIAIGQLKAGEAIPNEYDLSREFGVSPGTIRKALAVLEVEHLITRKQGKGTYVNDHSSGELAVRFSNIRGADGERIAGLVKDYTITLAKAEGLERQRLRLDRDVDVYRIRRVRYLQDRPYMVDETSMPADLFPGLDEQELISHRIAVLAQTNGIVLKKAREHISIDLASDLVGKTLGIAAGTPVLVLDRVVDSLDGRAVEWRLGRCHFLHEQYMAEFG